MPHMPMEMRKCNFTLSLWGKQGNRRACLIFFLILSVENYCLAAAKSEANGNEDFFMRRNRDQFRPKIFPSRRKVHHVLNRGKICNQEIQFPLHCGPNPISRIFSHFLPCDSYVTGDTGKSQEIKLGPGY